MNLDEIMVLKTKMNPEGDIVMSELIVQGFSDQFRIHEFENPTDFRGEELIKIFFILLLICQLSQVTACDTDKYEHDGVCCPLCSAGNVVAKHCTVQTDTECNPCPSGEYIGHPNGFEKCLKCKTCKGGSGLQIEQECTSTLNTICKPKKGHYCIRTNCAMAKIHSTCPAGHGVKEKGTQLNDTVCDMCPAGTFSRTKSSTEACMNWTVCDELNLQLFEPGSSDADVKCAEANNNLRIIIPVIAIAVIILILIGAIVFWRYPELRPRLVQSLKVLEFETLFFKAFKLLRNLEVQAAAAAAVAAEEPGSRLASSPEDLKELRVCRREGTPGRGLAPGLCREGAPDRFP
ncbi:tumor necrosis factor receptor superfamily member 5-like [Rhinoraja longicauda]